MSFCRSLATVVEPFTCLHSVYVYCVSISLFVEWNTSQPRACIALWSFSFSFCTKASFWGCWLFSHYKTVSFVRFLMLSLVISSLFFSWLVGFLGFICFFRRYFLENIEVSSWFSWILFDCWRFILFLK